MQRQRQAIVDLSFKILRDELYIGIRAQLFLSEQLRTRKNICFSLFHKTEKCLKNDFLNSHSFFFYLGFFSRPFTNHRTAGEEGGHFFSPSLPLLPTSQTLGHWPGDGCRQLNSGHKQQLDSNREPLVSKGKSLTTKLCALV